MAPKTSTKKSLNGHELTCQFLAFVVSTQFLQWSIGLVNGSLNYIVYVYSRSQVHRQFNCMRFAANYKHLFSFHIRAQVPIVLNLFLSSSCLIWLNQRAASFHRYKSSERTINVLPSQPSSGVDKQLSDKQR